MLKKLVLALICFSISPILISNAREQNTQSAFDLLDSLISEDTNEPAHTVPLPEESVSVFNEETPNVVTTNATAIATVTFIITYVIAANLANLPPSFSLA